MVHVTSGRRLPARCRPNVWDAAPSVVHDAYQLGKRRSPHHRFPKLMQHLAIVKQRRPAACLVDPGPQHSRIVGARSATPLHWRYRVEDDACPL